MVFAFFLSSKRCRQLVPNFLTKCRHSNQTPMFVGFLFVPSFVFLSLKANVCFICPFQPYFFLLSCFLFSIFLSSPKCFKFLFVFFRLLFSFLLSHFSNLLVIFFRPFFLLSFLVLLFSVTLLFLIQPQTKVNV